MTWKFDSSVASTFRQHARQHIPNYEQVLSLTTEFLQDKLQPSDAILEFGCAVGETVERLSQAGFSNIHAVDRSQDMLDLCPPGLANYYCMDSLPNTGTPYKAILCNWTLSFNINKLDLLEKFYHALDSDGYLILSEKTKESGLSLEQYHKYKLKQGVSPDAIQAKARALKGVMHVDSVEWYINALHSCGFDDVSLVNANWCFTTFINSKGKS